MVMRRAACRTDNASIFNHKNMLAYVNLVLSYAYETPLFNRHKTTKPLFQLKTPAFFSSLSFLFFHLIHCSDFLP